MTTPTQADLDAALVVLRASSRQRFLACLDDVLDGQQALLKMLEPGKASPSSPGGAATTDAITVGCRVEVVPEFVYGVVEAVFPDVADGDCPYRVKLDHPGRRHCWCRRDELRRVKMERPAIEIVPSPRPEDDSEGANPLPSHHELLDALCLRFVVPGAPTFGEAMDWIEAHYVRRAE